jgi:hypothetical protein
MGKVIRLTEDGLARLIKRIIKESGDDLYSGDNLKNLYSNLSDDEDVSLSDTTGTLYGRKVSKKEYLENMLIDAIDNEDWGKVHHAISYLKSKM